MKLLLDTHVFLWMHAEPERLSASARELLVDPETALVLSVVVPWEAGIKVARKRLTLPEQVEAYFVARAHAAGMTILPIELRHVVAAAALPRHHADPFDRMLVAQARTERLTLLSADPELARYDVTLMNAA